MNFVLDLLQTFSRKSHNMCVYCNGMNFIEVLSPSATLFSENPVYLWQKCGRDFKHMFVVRNTLYAVLVFSEE